MANASVQQEHKPLLLHAVTLVSQVVIVSEHVPDKVGVDGDVLTAGGNVGAAAGQDGALGGSIGS